MVERYTQTIDALIGSLNLDYKLDKKILDIIPKLVEARARYWTKGAHGYFTGPYSDGKSAGCPNCSGGMGVIPRKGGGTVVNAKSITTKSRGGADVTDLYEKIAAPNTGTITYDEGYNEKLHKAEIDFANWLHSYYGGDVHLLKEINLDKVSTPDFIWNNKMWDLKSVTSEKAANSAVRKGLKQIAKRPGGVFLDYGKANISVDLVQQIVDERMKWYKGTVVDIVIVQKGL